MKTNDEWLELFGKCNTQEDVGFLINLIRHDMVNTCQRLVMDRMTQIKENCPVVLLQVSNDIGGLRSQLQY